MSEYYEKMSQKFIELARDNSQMAFDTLVELLENRDYDTIDKHIIPYFASRALLAKGEIGLNALIQILKRIDGFIYPMAILETIWQAGRGSLAIPLLVSIEQVASIQPGLNDALIIAAQDAFIEIVSEARESPEAFHRLINFLYHQNIRIRLHDNDEGYREFHYNIFQVLFDSTVRISQRLINQFEALLSAGHKEEELQQFLFANPVFLHPLASQVLNKHKLGDDFITDYVIETLTGEYIAVEIEKPSDVIITKKGDMTALFTHAFGQVLDFIDWVERNIAYAQTKLPGISTPKGLLVIGRLDGLTQKEINKLRRFSKNSMSIEIVTFNDLLDRAKALYRNIRHRIEFQSL